MTNLHTYIEHTLLKPTATAKDIVKLCNEAKKYNFYGVCVPSCFVYLAANELKNHSAKVITTVGFPLGTTSTNAKVAEAKQAIDDGADEIDMVINLGFFKSQLTKPVSDDIRAVKKVIGKNPLKVIIETCFLSKEEILVVCEIVKKAGANYVKTSTGFGTNGALVDDVKLIKKCVGNQLKIKASGGIKNTEQAVSLIKAGANKIGTSNGIAIVYDTKNHTI